MNTKARGSIGEEIAVRYLENKGYTVLARNEALCGAEVDIVAYKSSVYVFCEVKTRSDNRFGSPAESITPAKIARYVMAANGYIVKHRLPDTDIRFDVIEIADGEINHIEGAFDCSDAARYRKKRY